MFVPTSGSSDSNLPIAERRILLSLNSCSVLRLSIKAKSVLSKCGIDRNKPALIGYFLFLLVPEYGQGVYYVPVRFTLNERQVKQSLK